MITVFFSRNGGVSKGLYKSLNCGRGSKDSKQNISKNLKIVSKKMKVESNNIILMYQTHSSKVVEINKSNIKKKVNSDSIITKIKGFALGVVTADCVPILLFDYKNKIIGCVHAGWKGAIKGVIKNTISKIRSISPNNQIFACIGPCIGKKSYEVDIKFYKRFIQKSKKNKRYFLNKGEHKKLFDLRKFVKDKLIKHKVKVDHVNYDTFTESKKFFSYRRTSILKERDYGRCISLIKLN